MSVFSLDHSLSQIQHSENSYAEHLIRTFYIILLNRVVDYQIEDLKISTAPIYNFLIDGGYNLDILIFSGDDDAVCSTLGTQKWVIEYLHFSIFSYV